MKKLTTKLGIYYAIPTSLDDKFYIVDEEFVQVDYLYGFKILALLR